MRLLRLIYLLAIWCITVSSAIIEEPPEDALEEMGYDVENSGRVWKVRRNGVIVDKFEIDHYSYQLTIKDAWNEMDTSPRLRLHQIMALVWERSGAAISQLSVVRVERIDNDETKDAIQEARQAANVGSSESLTVGPGETGWAELKASPFFRSVASMCRTTPGLSAKEVELMTVPSRSRGSSLDNMMIHIQ
ncbi:hypothetical protein Cob_v004409 [Colletotrichum orbiculare MAFF 240422]|uniref:Uncharacterized protein n=1 Tax=Colletotrichum orbiculare (strain 104-T / ATCC 96160 / CBS 514.97 / LARS 414 / MAFF 240422) TaxID=1213857 RepID=N4VLP5_COLOR|nr:hypothetical protein Cob_v004409 [Colletotrichum orbiculare MAFF 240422]